MHVLVMPAAGADGAPYDRVPDFANDIFPIFQMKCIPCHSSAKSEGGLNLESFDAASLGGDSGDSFEVGNAAESGLVLRVTGVEEIMPPEGNNVGAAPFTDEEIALLTRWIDSGATAGKTSINKPMEWEKIHESIRPIYSLDVSKDGQYLVVGRGNVASVLQWPLRDVPATTALHDSAVAGSIADLTESATHVDIVQSVAINEQGTRVATGGFREVKVWERKETPVYHGIAKRLRGSAFAVASPDGKWLAKGTQTSAIEIIHTADGAVAARMDMPVELSIGVWGPGSDRLFVQTDDGYGFLLELAVLDGGEFELRRLAEMAFPFRFKHLWLSESNGIHGADQDGKLFGFDFYLKNSETDSTAAQSPWMNKGWKMELASVQALTEVAGRLAVASSDGSISVFDSAQLDVTEPKALQLIQHGGNVVSVSLSLDGRRLFSVGKAGDSKCWNLEDGSLVWENLFDVPTEKRSIDAEAKLARHRALVERNTAAVPELEKAHQAEVDNVVKLVTSRDGLAESVKAKVQEIEVQTKHVEEGESVVAAAQAALEEAQAKLEAAQKDLEARKKSLSDAQAAKGVEDAKLEGAEKSLANGERLKEKSATDLADYQSELETKKATLAELEATTAKEKAEMNAVPAVDAVLTLDGTTLLTLRESGALHAIHAETGQNQSTIAGGPPHSGSVTVAGNDMVFAIHEDGRSVAWNIGNHWELVRTIGGEDHNLISDRVTALAFDPSGERLVVGSGPPSRYGDLKLFDAASGELIRDWGQVHSDTILSAEFSPDGAWVATGGADKQVRLSPVSTEESQRTFEGHTHHVLGVAWHDDGHLLGSSSADNTVKIWNIEKGQADRTLAGFGKEVTGLAFVGRSNQLMSSASDALVRVHNIGDGSLVRTIAGASDSLYALVAFENEAADPKTATAISGGQEGTIWVWKVEDGQVIKKIP